MSVVGVVVLAALVVIVVFGVAAVVIGRESNRLGRQRHLPTYRLADAVDWVAERLDDDVAARLTHDEVRRLLGWHLAELQRQAEEGDLAAASGSAAVADDPGLVEVVEQAAAAGLDLDVDEIAAVLSLQLDYLQALGALRRLGG